jgi:hypothetical protein
MKVKALNKLATEMVGDGGKPNTFFVSLGANVQMVTTNFNAAYRYWCELKWSKRQQQESMLEDRRWGTICCVEPKEDGSKKLITYDESYSFRKIMRPNRS